VIAELVLNVHEDVYNSLREKRFYVPGCHTNLK
jgi:hypothetical protein